MAGKPSQGTSFVVHLKDLDLPEDQHARLARIIQGAVLTEIARADFSRGAVVGAPLTIHIPDKEWLGLWLERIGRLPVPIPQVNVGPIGQ